MEADIARFGLLDDHDIELDHAALALSELDHEGIDVEPYVDLLRQIGGEVESRGRTARTAAEQGEALAHVFSGEFGFEGDVESYDAPLNADLIRVLDRRRGLPVSLSILYVAAARRAGWVAHVLNTPGHVLVRVGDEQPSLIDPFNGGVPVSRKHLAALLYRALGPAASFRPEYLAPMANRAVLARLLLNQASRAESEGDLPRALTVYQRMTLVAPENPDGWWDLARIQLLVGDVPAARASLSAMLEVTRDEERRRRVSETLASLASD